MTTQHVTYMVKVNSTRRRVKTGHVTERLTPTTSLEVVSSVLLRVLYWHSETFAKCHYMEQPGDVFTSSGPYRAISGPQRNCRTFVKYSGRVAATSNNGKWLQMSAVPGPCPGSARSTNQEVDQVVTDFVLLNWHNLIIVPVPTI